MAFNMSNVQVMSELEITNAALAVGWVKFSYTKADGTKRVAVGTRNHEIIRAIIGDRDNTARTDRYFHNCNSYYDLTRGDWRSFNASRFIGLELQKMDTAQAVHDAVQIALSEDKEDTKTIERIEMVSVKLQGAVVGGKVFHDSKAEWCMKYNHGRGLNGVLLSAGNIVSSGYDCFGSPISHASHAVVGSASGQGTQMSTTTTATATTTTERTTETKATRAELIKELMNLRKRESEILAELLA